MKKALCLIVALWAVSLYAQEFQQYANGLIYADSTIGKLKHIADSLQLKFKVCSRNSHYDALEQGRGHLFTLHGKNVGSARADMKAGISWDVMRKKYPEAKADTGLMIAKIFWQDTDGEQLQEVTAVSMDGEGNQSGFEPDKEEPWRKGTWIIERQRTGQDQYMQAFYVTEVNPKIALPRRYADMIQYADCLIDTSQQIFSKGKPHPGVKSDSLKAVPLLLAYADSMASIPEAFEDSLSRRFSNDEDYLLYWNAMYAYRYSRLYAIAGTDSFRHLLKTAVEEALANNETYNDSYSLEWKYSNEEFERLTALFYTPEAALELKRGRIVTGMCSMDSRPRQHALGIAQYAAAATAWEVFLRAHLDIMNDNFARGTDGSYAWGARQTYIRELEVLDINVPDLLLGTIFRYRDPARNHYSGDIARIGRAIAETQSPDIMEQKILGVIQDKKLDLYNRILGYYLFLHYNFNLKDVARQKHNENKLKVALVSFPAYLSKNAITRFKDEAE